MHNGFVLYKFLIFPVKHMPLEILFLSRGGSTMEVNTSKLLLPQGFYFLRINSANGKNLVVKLVSE